MNPAIQTLVDRERHLITNRLIDLEAYLAEAKEANKMGRLRLRLVLDMEDAVRDLRYFKARIEAWETVDEYLPAQEEPHA